tara:strand:+ start:7246 stop:7422 length:177 start_codon:yes stop_codon:yes gene_type:complete
MVFKTAFVECDLNEERCCWNLIAVTANQSGEESTVVTPFATKDQAEEAKEIFLNKKST